MCEIQAEQRVLRCCKVLTHDLFLMHASRPAGDTLPKSPNGRACVASLAMAVASEHGASSSAERTHWNLPGYTEWYGIMGQKLKASLKKGGVTSWHAEGVWWPVDSQVVRKPG